MSSNRRRSSQEYLNVWYAKVENMPNVYKYMSKDQTRQYKNERKNLRNTLRKIQRKPGNIYRMEDNVDAW